MSDLWPWILLALLGAYHGLNPAMGWLFAVSLGLQERDRRAVLRALPPIAIGHELALVVVVVLVVLLGLVADPAVLHLVAAAVLILFGIWRFAKPRSHPRWVRGQVTGRELTFWSFLMSSAHGAGLMIAPVLIGAGAVDAQASEHQLAETRIGEVPLLESVVGLALHVGAMLAVMAIVALLVYDRLGVRVLRKAWLNGDQLWAASFVLAGVITLVT